MRGSSCYISNIKALCPSLYMGYGRFSADSLHHGIGFACGGRLVTYLISKPCVPPFIWDMVDFLRTHCIMALVLRVGSSGRKFLYSSTSFSNASSCDWSRFRKFGSVSRMWLVSCWFRVRCRYGVPILSAMCLDKVKRKNKRCYDQTHFKKILPISVTYFI